MNIRQLEYFLEVSKQESFSKAAAILHVSQPSISEMIKNLEDELGTPLLYRGAKRLELTDAGQIVQEQAEQIVTLFNNLAGNLKDSHLLQRGKIRIGIPSITASTVFPRVLGEFKRQYPHIELQLHEYGSKKIRQGVNEGALDIGIVCSLPDRHENFEVLPFVEDPLQLIVHPEHALATLPAVDFADLRNEGFVLYSEDFSLHDQILARCKLAGFQPIIICETSQREFMTQMVAAKLGVALLPGKICAELDPDPIVAVPLKDPQMILQLAVIWRKDRYMSFAARRWLDFTAAHFAPQSTLIGSTDQQGVPQQRL